MGMFDEDPTTADVLRGMIPPRPPVPSPSTTLRGWASAIQNPEHAISLRNMAAGGLNTAANWLDYAKPNWRQDILRPEDTLAPLGASVLASPFVTAPAGALTSGLARRSAEAVTPTVEAIRPPQFPGIYM